MKKINNQKLAQVLQKKNQTSHSQLELKKKFKLALVA